jgi:hypothetical protein
VGRIDVAVRGSGFVTGVNRLFSILVILGRGAEKTIMMLTMLMSTDKEE